MEAKPLRILIVRQSGFTQFLHAVTMANFLQGAGRVVSMVSIQGEVGPVPGLHEGIEVNSLGPPRKKSGLMARLGDAFRLRRFLKAKEFDLLYVLDSWTLPFLWMATLGRLRWRQTKLVYHTFDWLEPGLVHWVHRHLEGKALRRADLSVNTDRARARLQKTVYGLKKVPLWVQNSLPMGLEIPAFDASVRAAMTGDANPAECRIVIYPTVISTAGPSERMIEELIEAFRYLPESYHLALFYREGAGYLRCKGICEEMKIASRVHFLSPVPYHRLLALVAAADLGVVFYDERLSSGYFMCNADKLSLYAACGIPFVASEQPNLEAIVYRYGLGQCCDPKDPRQVAKAIRAIADDRVALEASKRNARKMFLEHLHFELQGRKLVEALEQL